MNPEKSKVFLNQKVNYDYQYHFKEIAYSLKAYVNTESN